MASEDTSPTVMLAVDGSAQSEAAFDWYIENASNPSHRLVVGHCVVPPTIYGAMDHQTYNEIYEDLCAKGKVIQEKFSALFKQHGVKGAFLSGISKDPADWIIQRAKEVKPIMIVIGSRGLGSVRRTLLGSNSTYVLHHAHCAVAVCPSAKQPQGPEQARQHLIGQ